MHIYIIVRAECACVHDLRVSENGARSECDAPSREGRNEIHIWVFEIHSPEFFTGCMYRKHTHHTTDTDIRSRSSLVYQIYTTSVYEGKILIGEEQTVYIQSRCFQMPNNKLRLVGIVMRTLIT